MMTSTPFPGAFPHQHHDQRSLVERIEAQLRERIEEAVDMAGLRIMVDLRERRGLARPETTSEADRREFEATAVALLRHLRDAFHADLATDQRAGLERLEATQDDPRQRLLAGQVHLARLLPDYWQRFERYERAFAESRLDPPARRAGWLSRLWSRG
ncbi:MAG TPA: hypothetical protein VFO18_04185 [Methylomirabilota bacterium]|nr:hypothetical protein [Methylomirabilota bacterium]